jgi:hypothetical protein
MQTYAGFAGPHAPIDTELLDFMMAEYARTLFATFRKRLSSQLRSAEALLSTIESDLNGRLAFDTVWNPGLGQLRAAMRPGGELQALRSAAQFGLDLLSHRLSGSWECAFAQPAQLRWSHWVLPETNELRAVSDGQHATLRTRNGAAEQEVVLVRHGAAWESQGASATPHARLGNRHIPILLPWALACAMNDDIRPRLVMDLDEARIVADLQAGVDLLERVSPLYASWVSRVIRGIIPLAAASDLYLSGSYPDRPGLITCSFPTPAAVLAEIMVHESSHQYFHILGHLGDFEDGSDTELYYSPIRRQNRPLIYILLAYHAVGNMVLFQRIRGKAMANSGAEEREAELQDWFEQLERPLRETAGLTPLGHALWRPLSARVKTLVEGSPRPLTAPSS